MYIGVIKALRSPAGKKCLILLTVQWVTPTDITVIPRETQVFRKTNSLRKDSLSELKQSFGLTLSE